MGLDRACRHHRPLIPIRPHIGTEHVAPGAPYLDIMPTDLSVSILIRLPIKGTD